MACHTGLGVGGGGGPQKSKNCRRVHKTTYIIYFYKSDGQSMTNHYIFPFVLLLSLSILFLILMSVSMSSSQGICICLFCSFVSHSYLCRTFVSSRFMCECDVELRFYLLGCFEELFRIKYCKIRVKLNL